MDQAYRELSARLGFGQSENLAKIWSLLLNEEEAAIAILLPATVDDVAERSGRKPEDTERILTSLYQKGAAFKRKRDGQISYKLPRDLMQFHDASVLWAEASTEFFDTWVEMMTHDLVDLVKTVPDNAMPPPLVRVVPIEKAITTESKTLSSEECEAMLNNADKVAVINCPCRTAHRNCDAPVEACLQLDKGAEYALDRGHGREISVAEALNIIRVSEEAGLVHVTENRARSNIICNCCGCCCEMYRVLKHTGRNFLTAPSRFSPVVDDDLCTLCEECVEACNMGAISVGETVEFNRSLCIGCGQCVGTCPEAAASLIATRPEEHIPAGN